MELRKPEHALITEVPRLWGTMSLGLLERSVSFSVTIQLCYRSISSQNSIIGYSEAVLGFV